MDIANDVQHYFATDALARQQWMRTASPSEHLAVAHALKAQVDAVKHYDLHAAHACAALLDDLAQHSNNADVIALAYWVRGTLLAHDGHPEAALHALDHAAAWYTSAAQSLDAARVQVTRVFALATAGRYDEAVHAAFAARAVFEAAQDALQVARLDFNLGNIFYFTARYSLAQQMFAQCEPVLAAYGDSALQMSARDGQAQVLVELGHYAQAAALHEETLRLAEALGDEMQAALTLHNLGYLYAQQGNYQRAIPAFEQAQRRFADLGIEQEQLASEMELAAAYLDLNLADEVLYRTRRLVPRFRERSLLFEAAYSLALQGMALGALGQWVAAHESLRESEELFVLLGNRIWQANIALSQARIATAQGQFQAALHDVERAYRSFADEQMTGRLTETLWMRGDLLRRLGRSGEAQRLLLQAANEAHHAAMPLLEQRCVTSLALLAHEQGDAVVAQSYFLQAAELIEQGRAPLPGEALRMAYMHDKLIPFAYLVHNALALRDPQTAFTTIQRARARALLDLMETETPPQATPNSLTSQRDELRRALQVRYHRLYRPHSDDAHAPEDNARLHTEIADYEHALSALDRQLRSDGGGTVQPLSLQEVQHLLGTQRQLIDFWVDDDGVSALIVSNAQISLVPTYTPRAALEEVLQRLQFQLNKFRLGATYMQQHGERLLAATLMHLRRLYDLLIRPIAAHLHTEHLVVVPHGPLHYIPFAALHDGQRYLIEQTTLSMLPSASLLAHCQHRPRHSIERPLLVGVPDQAAPLVEEEVRTLAQQLSHASLLLGEAATSSALQTQLAHADALHLACHAIFRPTNPLFSALRLGDGWMTVRDVYHLDLRQCELVVLSACETGVNHIAPGDEILGLARGFLSAGGRALVLSHWPAHDTFAAQLMPRLYQHLRSGKGYAAALRQAQLELMETMPHPFYWAAFFSLSG